MNKKHISLELAQSIAEVAKGVELPKSEYYWAKRDPNLDHLEHIPEWSMTSEPERNITYGGQEIPPHVPAYDCQELGEILKSQNIAFFVGYAMGGDFILDIPVGPNDTCNFRGTEVEAKGKMLKYLLKNNLYKNDK